ncbi:MAG: hypothetical protein Q8R47_00140 [Nanoarchaeota archaeon]|nr:hypothetical protein [Nanoarchaeota archaeon]
MVVQTLDIQYFTLAVILGTLLAIVYSLRVLILLERRVASMEMNIQKLTGKVLKEEVNIQKALSHKRRR